MPSPSDVRSVSKQQQFELAFDKIGMKPLHILYLMAIHAGDFDDRLRAGHFAMHEVFSTRIRELIAMGLVNYDGRHGVTPLGVSHVQNLITLKPVL